MTRNEGSGGESPVEQYLDELTRLLAAGHPRHLRYLLSETEAHLHDDVDAAIAAGAGRADAEAQAVARIGAPEALAHAELDRQRPPLREIVRRAVASGVLLAAIGAVAIGISGVIAGVIRAIGGAGAVADAGRSPLSATDCARWLAIYPGAGSCRAAATADWAAEATYYRIAVGVLGVLAVAVIAGLRRRGRLSIGLLPRIVVDSIAAAAFTGAAAWTLVLGIDALAVSSGRGWGQWLSATPVALAGAVVFAMRAVQDLRAGSGEPIRARG